MLIGISGGSGYLGRFIVEHFIEKGDKCRILSRNPKNILPFSQAIDMHKGELSPTADYTDFCQGLDILIHTAYEHQQGQYRYGEGNDLTHFVIVNIAGSIALLETAKKAGVNRAVILSSRAVFDGYPKGIELFDTTPIKPDTHYGALKSALEAFMRSFAAQDNWPICALRPTGIYGITSPIEQSKWYSLIGDILQDRPIAARRGTEVHGCDVAKAIDLLCHAPANIIAGCAFNCSDLLVTHHQIAEIVAQHTNRSTMIPEESSKQRFSIMDCTSLKTLGMQFGGIDLLHKTIKKLILHHLK